MKKTKKPQRLPFIEDARQLPANINTVLAAAFIGKITPTAVSRFCARGELHANKIGNGWVIPRENLIAFTRGQEQPIQCGCAL